MVTPDGYAVTGTLRDLYIHFQELRSEVLSLVNYGVELADRERIAVGSGDKQLEGKAEMEVEKSESASTSVADGEEGLPQTDEKSRQDSAAATSAYTAQGTLDAEDRRPLSEASHYGKDGQHLAAALEGLDGKGSPITTSS